MRQTLYKSRHQRLPFVVTKKGNARIRHPAAWDSTRRARALERERLRERLEFLILTFFSHIITQKVQNFEIVTKIQNSTLPPSPSIRERTRNKSFADRRRRRRREERREEGKQRDHTPSSVLAASSLRPSRNR